MVSKRTVGRVGSAKLGAPARELGVEDLKKAVPEGRRRRCRGWPWRRRPGGPPQLPPGPSLITGGRGDAGGSPVEATGGVVGKRRAVGAVAAALDGTNPSIKKMRERDAVGHTRRERIRRAE